MINVTALSDFLYCPRKLYLQEVLKIIEIPKEIVVVGTVKHEVYDRINKEDESIVKSIGKTNLHELGRIYSNRYSELLREAVIKHKEKLLELNLKLADVFRRSWKIVAEEARLRSANVNGFIKANDVFGEELWDQLTPKIKSELKVFSTELKLKGIVDIVEIYDNRYVPIELKTGKAPKEGLWPGHRIQVAAYLMLLENKFNVKAEEGYVNYLDANEKRPVVLNPFLKEEVKELTEKVIALLESKDIPPFCKNVNKCEACGMKDFCFDENIINEEIKEAFFG